VRIQVRWDRGGTESADDYGNENLELGIEFFIHMRIILTVKKVEFVSYRMSYIYITLRGRWCDIIVLNVHGPTEDKSGDTEDSCC
jgi:hypothetical protein